MQVNKNCTQLLVGLSKHVEHYSTVWTMLSYPPNESTVCIIPSLQHFFLSPPRKAARSLGNKDKLDIQSYPQRALSPGKESDEQINSQGILMSDMIDLDMTCPGNSEKNNLT